jgi:transposase-like protein
MPWREICPMDDKMRLVAAVLADEHSMSELCASLGVSRKVQPETWVTHTGY